MTVLLLFPWRKSLDAFLDALLSLNPKWLTFIGFVIQNTIFLIIFHACSIYESHQETEYLPSTVVIFTELWKLSLSLIVSFVVDGNCSLNTFAEVLIKAFVDDGIDFLRLCLPALLYAIQNNLQYIIDTSPLFTIMYQTKVVTTAVFFSMMLMKRIHRYEWLSIVTLAIGVSLVESSQHEAASAHHISNVLGIVAVVIACITSGFAGVYFEKVLKSSKSSVWILNIQLSMMSFSFCTIIALSENPEEIIKFGVFKGFNCLVWLVIVLQAISGLMIAMVVKYADNIHKGYGASMSIVVATTINSALFHDVSINSTFGIGSLLVFLSTYSYIHFFSSNEGHHAYQFHPATTTSNPSNNVVITSTMSNTGSTAISATTAGTNTGTRRVSIAATEASAGTIMTNATCV